MASEEVTRVLVTGATGFIASHVVQKLLQAGHHVRGSVRSLQGNVLVLALKNLERAAADRLEFVEADLLEEACWGNAVAGCSHVLHIASPVSFKSPADENDMIGPAVQGTTNVLRACADSGTVKRVVVTSDVLAICGAYTGGNFTEKKWGKIANPHVRTYAKSKILAEKAAWDFIKKQNEDSGGDGLELVVLNPVAVLGPSIIGNESVMQKYIEKIMTNKRRMVPRCCLPVVDVRDVATAHVRAVTAQEVAGKRIIITEGQIFMPEILKIIRAEFAPQGYNIKTSNYPDWLAKMRSSMKKDMKIFTMGLGKKNVFDDERMREYLHIEPIDKNTMVIDTVYSLIQDGYVPKTPKYKGKVE